MKIFPSERINSANYLEMININLKDNFQNAPLLVENLKGKGFTNINQIYFYCMKRLEIVTFMVKKVNSRIF